jgi:hypothetical protein
MKDVPLQNFVYKGEGYTFQFKNQREAFHSSIVVAPRHLKIVSNTTGKTNEDLMPVIVWEWFEAENVLTRARNALRRKL